MRWLLLVLYVLAALGDATAKALAANRSISDDIARKLPPSVAASVANARRPEGNFEIFRTASQRLMRGEDLYAPYPNRSQDRFKYSPTFALLFVPLTWLPWPLALFLWNALNGLVLFTALERLLPPSRAYVALACLLPEVLRSMQNAQSNAFVAALIIFTFVSLERGRAWRGAAAAALGGFIKIFPVAALAFAIPRRKSLIVGAAALTIGVALALAPLMVATPTQLLAQYRSWMFTESADAPQRWFSIMELFHRWFGGDAPNWPWQLAGTIVLLAPLAIRRERWSDHHYRLVFLCSLLLYVTLFNHQAERSSYLIAFVGASIWFAASERTPVRVVLYGVALLTIPLMSTLLPVPAVLRSPTAMAYRLALPMSVIWLVMQRELLSPAPNEAAARLELAEMHETNEARV